VSSIREKTCQAVGTILYSILGLKNVKVQSVFLAPRPARRQNTVHAPRERRDYFVLELYSMASRSLSGSALRVMADE